MPHHIHFLIRIKATQEVSEVWKNKYPDKDDATLNYGTLELFVIQQFSHLLNGYTQAYNKMYKRRGSLLIHLFKRKEITDDYYLTCVNVYIHSNPVNQGFVKDISDWKWTSNHSSLSVEPTTLLREEVVKWFGNKEEFISFHQQQPFEGSEPSKGYLP